MKNFAEPGDVVLGISGSGNSPNVLRAFEYAKQVGCTTIGACGYDGGKMKGMADHAFHVKVDDMQIAEDVHLILGPYPHADIRRRRMRLTKMGKGHINNLLKKSVPLALPVLKTL